MKKTKKDPIVVYWCPEPLYANHELHTLLVNKPEKLFTNVVKNKRTVRYKPSVSGWVDTDGYHMCEAFKNLSDNTFIYRAPFSVDIQLDKEGMIQESLNSVFFGNRIGSFEDCYAIDFFAANTFFCEEPLEISITPPYMHQTSQPEYGFICSVKYDIGRWFRPMVMIYQLWKDKNKIYFQKDEPLAYYHFHTDREVKLVQFVPNKKIKSIAGACLYYKTVIPFQPLDVLYKKFVENNINKQLIAEIKQNLL
jgi:hypothetical protein